MVGCGLKESATRRPEQGRREVSKGMKREGELRREGGERQRRIRDLVVEVVFLSQHTETCADCNLLTLTTVSLAPVTHPFIGF